MLKQLCICDQCGHVWVVPEVPARCANCKKRSWNGTKSTSNHDEAVLKVPDDIAARGLTMEPELPVRVAVEASSGKFDKTLLELQSFDMPSYVKPVAEFADDAEPYRASDKPQPKQMTKETLQGSLCRHGLYGPYCPRCA